jgi:hypothetical protein
MVNALFLEVLVLKAGPFEREPSLEELPPAYVVLGLDEELNGFGKVSGVEDRGLHPGIDAFDKEVNKGFSGAEGFACFAKGGVKVGSPWDAFRVGTL